MRSRVKCKKNMVNNKVMEYISCRNSVRAQYRRVKRPPSLNSSCIRYAIFTLITFNFLFKIKINSVRSFYVNMVFFIYFNIRTKDALYYCDLAQVKLNSYPALIYFSFIVYWKVHITTWKTFKLFSFCWKKVWNSYELVMKYSPAVTVEKNRIWRRVEKFSE